jgi:hypothetical protein
MEDTDPREVMSFTHQFASSAIQYPTRIVAVSFDKQLLNTKAQC